MNNKHQEALEKMFYYNMMPNDITEEELKQCDKILQELVDIYPEYLELKTRATPMKPEMLALDGFDTEVASHLCCRSCHQQISFGFSLTLQKPNYCSNCGQPFDWSGDWSDEESEETK